MNIIIYYDGKYPNLCSGNLTVTIDGIVWDFPDYCMCTGGSVWFDKEWNDYVAEGEWSISTWPENFPEELKEIVVEKINEEIPHGCCGGCV